MSAKPGENDAKLDAYEELYQVTVINVSSKWWAHMGYCLIGCSAIIMLLQALSIGPSSVWKRADDVTTILFTIELLVRVFEKGYLFFTEEEKNWNFFDSLVVAISLFSMIISAKAAQDANAQGGHASNGSAMNKMKLLRTMRLLRLLRLVRVCKSVEKVNQFVDLLLNSMGKIFVVLIIILAFSALVVTLVVAAYAGAKAWLMHHKMPTLPEIE